jgi:hypothetical protein
MEPYSGKEKQNKNKILKKMKEAVTMTLLRRRHL